MRALPSGLTGMAVVAMLAGCAASETGGPAPTASAAPQSEHVSETTGSHLSTCGADKLSGFAGVQASPETLAKIKETSGARTIRVVGPRDMMTMDYRIDRLTISTAEDGRIKSFRCV